jgi:hypothetical protein
MFTATRTPTIPMFAGLRCRRGALHLPSTVVSPPPPVVETRDAADVVAPLVREAIASGRGPTANDRSHGRPGGGRPRSNPAAFTLADTQLAS